MLGHEFDFVSAPRERLAFLMKNARVEGGMYTRDMYNLLHQEVIIEPVLDMSERFLKIFEKINEINNIIPNPCVSHTTV
jgi:hypothetical protein